MLKHWLRARRGPWWTIGFGVVVAAMIVVTLVALSVAGEMLLRAAP